MKRFHLMCAVVLAAVLCSTGASAAVAVDAHSGMTAASFSMDAGTAPGLLPFDTSLDLQVSVPAPPALTVSSAVTPALPVIAASMPLTAPAAAARAPPLYISIAARAPALHYERSPG